MTRPGWRLLSFLALALEPAEREVLLGDMAESDRSAYAEIPGLLGLIVRRQACLWMVWRPWLALLGVSCMAGVALSRIAFGFNVAVGLQLMAYIKYGVHYGTGVSVSQDMAFLVCIGVGLFVWSWTCGFALGSLSGRAVWVTWSVFYLVVLDSAWTRFVLSGNIILRDPQPLRLLIGLMLPLSPAGLLFLLAVFSGAFVGARRRFLQVRYVYLLASAVTILTILATWMTGWFETAHEVWSGGVWPATPWPTRLLPFLLISWPAIWLLTRAHRQRN
jgi:hypothetical protein